MATLIRASSRTTSIAVRAGRRFLAATIELCGVSPLSFAVGAYLPLSTTLPSGSAA